MIGSNNRPSDLAMQCVLALVAFIVGCGLYAMAGQRFTDWIVHTKLPEAQARMQDDLKFKTVVPEFKPIDIKAITNLNGVQFHGMNSRGGNSSESPED